MVHAVKYRLSAGHVLGHLPSGGVVVRPVLHRLSKAELDSRWVLRYDDKDF